MSGGPIGSGSTIRTRIALVYGAVFVVLGGCLLGVVNLLSRAGTEGEAEAIAARVRVVRAVPLSEAPVQSVSAYQLSDDVSRAAGEQMLMWSCLEFTQQFDIHRLWMVELLGDGGCRRAAPHLDGEGVVALDDDRRGREAHRFPLGGVEGGGQAEAHHGQEPDTEGEGDEAAEEGGPAGAQSGEEDGQHATAPVRAAPRAAPASPSTNVAQPPSR